MMGAVRFVLAFVASLVAMALAVPPLLLGLPFWITGAIVRRLARWLEPATVEWNEIYVVDPVIGWRPRPNLDVHLLADRDEVFHLITDRDGWHGPGSVEDSQVVVVGDSHAFGYGVDAEVSFAALLPDLRVKAVGAPAYNMVQELLLIRELAPKLAGKLVIWFVYVGNDVSDNLAPSQGTAPTPFLRRTDRGWEVVSHPPGSRSWTASSGRQGEYHLPIIAALHGPSYLAERAYDACAFLIAEGAELCRRAGARFVVMTIPSPLALDEEGLAELRAKARHADLVDPDYPDQRIREICDKLGVTVVALKGVLGRGHFKVLDDHWTEAGHRVVARTIQAVAKTPRGQTTWSGTTR